MSPASRSPSRATSPTHVILYFHGGVYVIGSAAFSVPLVGDLVRRTGAKAVTVDYRLAPEHPYPAAVEDARAAYEGLLAEGIAPAQIALAGESAGGGLAVATLLALRDAGVPLPSCAYLMSPYVDLTLSGESLAGKQEVDPILTPDGLRARVPDYVGGADAVRPQHQPDLRRSQRTASAADPGRLARGPAERRAPARRTGSDRPTSRSRSMSLRASRTSSRRMRASSMRPERRSTGHRTFSADQTRRLAEPGERQEFDMSDVLDWNAKTIAEFRANEGRVGGNFEGAPMVAGASPRPQERARARQSDDVPPARHRATTSSTSSQPREEHRPTPTGTTT